MLTQSSSNMAISDYHRLLAACCIATVLNAYPVTYIISFLPEMSLWMGYRDEDKGYVAGFVVSSYYIGRMLTSNLWGWMFNRVNHMYLVVSSLAMNAVFCLAFGFCAHLPEVIIVRFLIGFSNGVVTITRAIVFLKVDKSRQAFAVSAISTSWALGLSLSPFVAGYLAAPASQYPVLFAQVKFFTVYPYLLPAILGCFQNILALVLVIVIYPKDSGDTYETLVNSYELIEGTIFNNTGSGKTLKESKNLQEKTYHSDNSSITETTHLESMTEPYTTLNSYTDDKSSVVLDSDTPENSRRRLGKITKKSYTDDISLTTLGADIPENSKSRLAKIVKKSYTDDKSVTSGSDTPKNSRSRLGKLDKNLYTDDKTSVMHASDTPENSRSRLGKLDKNLYTDDKSSDMTGSDTLKTPRSRLANLIKNSKVWKPMIVLSAVTMIQFSITDIFPIWSSSEYELGGLNYATNQIGLIIGITSVPTLIVVTVVIPRIEARYGSVASVRVFIITATFSCTMIPTARYIADEWIQWVTVILLQFVFHLSVGSWLILTMLIINSGVTQDEIGEVNGLTCMVGCVAMALGPILLGNIYSGTVSSGIGPPIDASFTFVFAGIIAFSSFFMTLSFQ